MKSFATILMLILVLSQNALTLACLCKGGCADDCEVIIVAEIKVAAELSAATKSSCCSGGKSEAPELGAKSGERSFDHFCECRNHREISPFVTSNTPHEIEKSIQRGLSLENFAPAVFSAELSNAALRPERAIPVEVIKPTGEIMRLRSVILLI
ncbi:MAG: hypothetical protein NUW37_15545 [Planctomycetes bacterium]|nr:hypothetical protein [Planctomycetota bacterium]